MVIEHRVAVVPLNTSPGWGAGAPITFDPGQHAENERCSVLGDDPEMSSFRLRSGSLPCGIALAFFGLAPGDEIVLEFEAALLSGDVDSLQVVFAPIHQGAPGAGITQMLPPRALESHFKPVRVPFVVREAFAGAEGTLTVIRFEELDAEVALRDIVATVRTRNTRFALRNQIVALETRADFTKNLSLVQRSPIEPAFHGARALLRAGCVHFPEERTLAIDWPPGPERWSGVAAYLPASAYQQAVHVYYEVRDLTRSLQTPGERVQAIDGDFGRAGPEVRHVGRPTEGVWTSRFHTFEGLRGDKRLVLVAVGAEASAASTRMRKVRFALPRFDDLPDDRRPNQLDELFPDLGALLSP